MQFPEGMKSGRFLFDTENEYAGRLVGVTERSVENELDDLSLLRLEFEIFDIDETSPSPRLLATACIASRDIIVSAKATSDPKLVLYSELLGVTDVKNKASWYALEQSASAGQPKWIRIQFGPPDETDMRQPFLCIRELGLTSFTVEASEASVLLRGAFVRISEVRNILRYSNGEHPSDDTIKRFLDEHIEKFGENLLRWTGNQRRINWFLCWHLWEADRVGE